MSVKIALPYVVLAIVFAAGAAYLVSRYVVDTLQERFTNQLVDEGTLSVDWMVQEESRQLDTVRVLANTQGMAEALAAGDSESVRRLALPVVVNDRQEAVEVLDPTGASLLSMRHQAGGPQEAYNFDAVNMAQRLEGFTREFGATSIVISENTAAALEEHSAEFKLELPGTQTLKGKRQEVTAYRLHGPASAVEVARS